jgi:hypothetical protein
MKGEIDNDFYCSCLSYEKATGNCHRFKHRDGGLRKCADIRNECKSGRCDNYHHKWPTIEQFKEEYGEEYPEGGAMYFFESSWWPTDKENALANMEYYKKMGYKNGFAVCACTPFGNPDKDWRP